jgi:hypothetical protein
MLIEEALPSSRELGCPSRYQRCRYDRFRNVLLRKDFNVLAPATVCCRAPRSKEAYRLRVLGKTRSLSRKSSAAGSEEAWQSEFLPGSGAARPLQLHAGHIRAVRSSIRTVEAEAEVLSVPGNTDRLSPEGTASQPKWITDVTSQWDQLPGRYKVVFATSVAFVICNMVWPVRSVGRLSGCSSCSCVPK